jgi:hypothetical protein
VPVNPADSSHIALGESSAQCSASGLHLCSLCSAKWLKTKESSPAKFSFLWLLEDPKEGDGWALWAAKTFGPGACDIALGWPRYSSPQRCGYGGTANQSDSMFA